MDYIKSVVASLGSSFSIILGLITFNNIAILVGILSGISVIVERIISSVIKVKQYKKDVNRIDG